MMSICRSDSALCVIHSSGDHLHLLSFVSSCLTSHLQVNLKALCLLMMAFIHQSTMKDSLASHLIHFLCFYQFQSFPPSHYFIFLPSVLMSVPQHHPSLIFSFNHSRLSRVSLLISQRCSTEKTTFGIRYFQPTAFNKRVYSKGEVFSVAFYTTKSFCSPHGYQKKYCIGPGFVIYNS